MTQMEQNQKSPPLLLRARELPLTRFAVQELAAEIGRGADPGAATSAALSSRDPDAACALLFAAALAGKPPDASQVAAVAPLLSDLGLLPALIGCCRGDRLQVLLDLVEADQMSQERDALALLLAAEVLDGAEPPPRLLSLLRRCARRPLGFESGVLLGLAAFRVKDPDAQQVAAPWMAMAALPRSQKLEEMILKGCRRPLLEALPEQPRPRIVSGYTVRRAEAKVGRNDPCPCKSGKKYKKCCGAHEEARPRDASPVPGVSAAEYRARQMALLSEEEFNGISITELVTLDLPSLPSGHLCLAGQGFVRFHRWELAEKALSLLAERADLDDMGDVEELRAELIREAIKARAHDVLERQRGLLRDPDLLFPSDHLSLELMTPSASTLGRLEEVARSGLRGTDPDAPYDLAYSLLDHFPALGIFVARGSLSAERSLDSFGVLDAVEEARDCLLLPPRDPGWEVYDQLVDRHVAASVTTAAVKLRTAEQERLIAETDDLREKVKESSLRIATLEKRLSAQQAALQQALPPPPAAAPAQPLPGPAEEAERRRLQGKIAEFKSLIAEGNRERAELRQKLARLSDDLALEKTGAPAPAPAAPAATAPEAPDPDEAEEAEAVPGEAPARSRILVPVFSRAAQEALGTVPARVAREALAAVAALAGGDAAAWQAQKRLVHTAMPVSSYRVGLHHRLLFRARESALEVLELIHRKDLEGVLKRYR